VDNLEKERDQLLRDIERELGEVKAFQFRWQFQKMNPHKAGHVVRRLRVYLNNAPQKLMRISSLDKL